MESSLSSSCKRAKAGAVAVVGQAAQCLVDGCDADLSVCRDYHRRHKVCEAHSKTPKVSIGGREQRFCQQCSRFHSLVEFDEGKRSCRKRLDGHNRRRRKPQPQPPDSSSTTQHAAALQGTLVSFTSPHNSSCWGAGADHDNMLLYNTTTQLQLQLQHHHHNHNHNHNYYINNAERSPQSSFHLQNHDYSCDAALSLLSVPPPIPNLHYPAFPAPAPAPAPATHHHGSSTAASHHTRTFTWDH